MICKERGRSKMVTGEGTGHLLECSERWVGCGCGGISRSASISRANHTRYVYVCVVFR